MSNNEKIIKEVYCDAQNCVYNTSDCKCNAGNIAVGTKSACSSNETLCDTFKLGSTPR